MFILHIVSAILQAGDGGDVIEHPANLTDIVMFSFKKKSDKQKVSHSEKL